MVYTKLFDPTGREDLRSDEDKKQASSGDRRDGKVYVYDDGGEIVLAHRASSTLVRASPP